MHLSGICPGQVPPRDLRPTPTTRANFHGVGRCAAPARARNQRPTASPPLQLPTHIRPPDPGRCLQPRRHRSQRRRLHGPRARARCRHLRHHRRPCRRFSRASDRGTLHLPKVEPAHLHNHLILHTYPPTRMLMPVRLPSRCPSLMLEPPPTHSTPLSSPPQVLWLPPRRCNAILRWLRPRSRGPLRPLQVTSRAYRRPPMAPPLRSAYEVCARSAARHLQAAGRPHTRLAHTGHCPVSG